MPMWLGARGDQRNPQVVAKPMEGGGGCIPFGGDIDLVFGGGSYEHGVLAKPTEADDPNPPFLSPTVSRRKSCRLGSPPTPLPMGVCTTRTFWIGTALSSFGLIWNEDEFAQRELPRPPIGPCWLTQIERSRRFCESCHEWFGHHGLADSGTSRLEAVGPHSPGRRKRPFGQWIFHRVPDRPVRPRLVRVLISTVEPQSQRWRPWHHRSHPVPGCGRSDVVDADPFRCPSAPNPELASCRRASSYGRSPVSLAVAAQRS